MRIRRQVEEKAKDSRERKASWEVEVVASSS